MLELLAKLSIIWNQANQNVCNAIPFYCRSCDNYIAANGNMYQAIETILDSNNRTSINVRHFIQWIFLLKRWFLLFEGTETEILSHLRSVGRCPNASNGAWI